MTEQSANQTPAVSADPFQDPQSWILAVTGANSIPRPAQAEALRVALSTVLGDLPNRYGPDAVPALAVARLLRLAAHRTVGHYTPEFFRFGPLAVPASPQGVKAVHDLRIDARIYFDGGAFRAAAPDSALRRVAEAAELTVAGTAPADRVILGIEDRTDYNPRNNGRVGFDLALKLRPLPMPAGQKGPGILRQSGLIGVEIDGSRIDRIMRKAGLCDSGTADFLNRFEIPFEAAAAECDSCGAVDYDSEAHGVIDLCADFTVTADMVDYLDDEGYLDKVTRALDGAEGACDWRTFIDDDDAAEKLAAAVPDGENGIRFDPSFWQFVPDFARTIDAGDPDAELDRADLLLLLPLLMDVARRFNAADILPPIYGTLRPVGAVSTSGDWDWNPEAETLTHRPHPSGLALEYRPLRAAMLGMGPGTEPITFNVARDGTFPADANAAGDDAALVLAILQGEARL